MSQLVNGFTPFRVPRTVRWLAPLVVLLAGFGSFLRLAEPLTAVHATEIQPPQQRRVRRPSSRAPWATSTRPARFISAISAARWCFWTSGASAASTACTSCRTWPSSRRSTQAARRRRHSLSQVRQRKGHGNIRKAIMRYQITHPVINDAHLKIWNAYGVQSWPTFVLIDPEGYYVGEISSGGHYAILDRAIGNLVKTFRDRKELDRAPLRFLAHEHEKGDSPLYFPGKVLADAKGKRLFIADSTHHRIVITDLDGRKIAIAGNGQPGPSDGAFAAPRSTIRRGWLSRPRRSTSPTAIIT